MFSVLRFRVSAMWIIDNPAVSVEFHILLWMLNSKLLYKRHTFGLTVQIVSLSTPGHIISPNPAGLKTHSVYGALLAVLCNHIWFRVKTVMNRPGTSISLLFSMWQNMRYSTPLVPTACNLSPLYFSLPEETTSRHNSSQSKHLYYCVFTTNMLSGELLLDTQTSDVTSCLRLSPHKTPRQSQNVECCSPL